MVQAESGQGASVSDYEVTTVRLSKRQRALIRQLLGPIETRKPYRTQTEAIQDAIEMMLAKHRAELDYDDGASH